MQYLLIALSVLAVVGCDARLAKRPARRDPEAEAKELVELTKHAEEAIAAASEDPDVTPEELEIIKVLESARQSLLLTQHVLQEDVSGSVHPIAGELQSTLVSVLIQSFEDVQLENETHRDLCLKTATECEEDFPNHAESLRQVAKELGTTLHITRIQLHNLKKKTN